MMTSFYPCVLLIAVLHGAFSHPQSAASVMHLKNTLPQETRDYCSIWLFQHVSQLPEICYFLSLCHFNDTVVDSLKQDFLFKTNLCKVLCLWSPNVDHRRLKLYGSNYIPFPMAFLSRIQLSPVKASWYMYVDREWDGFDAPFIL